MRIQHIIITVLIFSLFAVVLFSESRSLFDELGMNESDYLDGVSDGNASDIFSSIDILTDTKDSIVDVGNSAPGGKYSTISEGDTTEASLQKSSLSVVTKVGTFLWSVPKQIIYKIGEFIPIRKEFMVVASTILILIVAIILVSSIMRNRI